MIQRNEELWPRVPQCLDFDREEPVDMCVSILVIDNLLSVTEGCKLNEYLWLFMWYTVQ